MDIIEIQILDNGTIETDVYVGITTSNGENHYMWMSLDIIDQICKGLAE